MNAEQLAILIDYFTGRASRDATLQAISDIFINRGGMSETDAVIQAQQFVSDFAGTDPANRQPTQAMFDQLTAEQRNQMTVALGGVVEEPVGTEIADPTITGQLGGGIFTDQIDPSAAGRDFDRQTADALSNIDRGDIFDRFLSRQPFANVGPIATAARGLGTNLERQFDIQFPQNRGLNPARGNPFQQFLEGGERLQGADLQGRLNLIADLIDAGPLEESTRFGGFESPEFDRAQGLQQQFGGNQFVSRDVANRQLGNQLDPFLLSATQGQSPQSRSAISSFYTNVFNRFRADNPFANFLDFARQRNFAGAFR